MRDLLSRFDPRRRTAGVNVIDAETLDGRIGGLALATRVAHGRLPGPAVLQAEEVLARAAARREFSADLTVVALAGATGAGKSSIFNWIVGSPIARAGVLRPTTGEPLAAAWGAAPGLAPLLDWLEVPRWHEVSDGTEAATGSAGTTDGPFADPAADPVDDLDEARADAVRADAVRADEVRALAQQPQAGPGPGGFTSGELQAGEEPGASEPATGPATGPAGRIAYDGSGDHQGLSGLVLLDLPDHDSTAAGHRAHVDRLVARADMMVWVLDPQKYADALVHDQYLKRFARHSEVTVVLLNQVDRLAPQDAQACLAHLRALLDADGLSGAVLLGTSATTGAGMAELRNALVAAAVARRAALARTAADVAAASDALATAAGDTGASLPVVSRGATARLAETLAEAAGVSVVAQAATDSVRLAGRSATGWPATRWLNRFRSDPLADLRLTRPGVDPALLRTSMPSNDPVAVAGAATAIREYAAAASVGAPPGWVRSTRRVAMEAVDDLVPKLDTALARAQVAPWRRPLWWSAVGAAQWLFLVLAALGALWLLGLLALGALAMPQPTPPTVGAIPAPTLMLVGGLLIGAVLAMLAALVNRRTAARAGNAARRAVQDEVAELARRAVTEPIDAELGTLEDFRVGLIAARGEG